MSEPEKLLEEKVEEPIVEEKVEEPVEVKEVPELFVGIKLEIVEEEEPEQEQPPQIKITNLTNKKKKRY